jgi:hypothetical protein
MLGLGGGPVISGDGGPCVWHPANASPAAISKAELRADNQGIRNAPDDGTLLARARECKPLRARFARASPVSSEWNQ